MIEAKSLTSHRSTPPGSTAPSCRVTPAATAARLPIYLRALTNFLDQGTSTVSSDQLATAAGVGSAVVRKDLSALSATGVRGVGYSAANLVDTITQELGLHHQWAVVIAGAGQLGQALANYPGFSSGDFQVAGIFDVGTNVGQTTGGVVVADISQLETCLSQTGPAIAVIAVPAAAAQTICDRFIAAGVRSILNFAPVVLDTPEDVEVRQVDLSTELQILAWHAQAREVSTAREGSATRGVGAEEPQPTSVSSHPQSVIAASPATAKERS